MPSRAVRLPSARTAFALFVLSACGGGGEVTPPPPQTQVLSIAAAAAEGVGRVTSEPAGIDCVVDRGVASGTCSASFAAAATVRLRSAPGALSEFGGWTGGCTGTDVCSIALDQARAVTVTFRRLPPQTLAVAGGGTGSGSVASEPDGVVCTVTRGAASGTCNAAFDVGTVVTLRGAADSLSDFGGWTGGGCTGTEPCRVTLAQAASVAATFERRAPQQVTVAASGTGVGTVTSDPAGISCTVDGAQTSGTCGAAFEVGTTVTLTATASAPVSEFSGWSGACTGATCQVVTTSGRAVSAAFQRRPPQQVAVTAAGKGSGVITSTPAGISCTVEGGTASGTCSAAFDVGANVVLSARASGTLSEFRGWTGACLGTVCELSATAPREAIAAFAGPTVTITADRLLPFMSASLGSGTMRVTPGDLNCVVVSNANVGPCAVELRPGEAFTVAVHPAAGEAGAHAVSPVAGISLTNCAFPAGTFTCTVTPNARVAVLRTQLFQKFVGVRGGPPISNGFGQVTSDVGGINCRITPGTATGVCGAEVGSATTEVVLSFTPEPGTTFRQWAADCGFVSTPTCTLVTNAPRKYFLVNATSP